MTVPTLTDAASMIREGKLSAQELLAECQTQIARLEPRLRSLLVRFDDAARHEARRADAEIAQGKWRGPLHGIPVVVKDHIDVAGAVTTAGTPLLAGNVAREDAPVVARLRHAGAVILAKANTHELAFGATTPPTRNPWDLARIPGGSSGGSGAAVGAGLVPAALGTDSGASVREPAALCGTVGLKPTIGRVPAQGLVPFAWSLDTVGPLARTVEDVAALELALEGRAGELQNWTPADLRVPTVSELRIAIAEEFMAPLQPDVERCFSALVDALVDAGARVSQVSIGDLDEMIAAILVIVGSEAYAYQRDWVDECRHLYSPDVLASVELGAEYSAVDYLDACRLRRAAERRLSAVLEDADVILTPAALITAPRVGETVVAFPDGDQPLVPTLIRPLAPIALAGHPAVSVPIGLGPATGLPVGAQLVGACDGDLDLLGVAAAVQSLSSWTPGTIAPSPAAGAAT